MADVPSAFISADMDEEVYMVLDGSLAEAMQRMCPEEYDKYIFKNKRGRNMLYVNLNKALWMPSQCITFLPQTREGIDRLWFRYKSIRSLRRKQAR